MSDEDHDRVKKRPEQPRVKTAPPARVAADGSPYQVDKARNIKVADVGPRNVWEADDVSKRALTLDPESGDVMELVSKPRYRPVGDARLKSAPETHHDLGSDEYRDQFTVKNENENNNNVQAAIDPLNSPADRRPKKRKRRKNRTVQPLTDEPTPAVRKEPRTPDVDTEYLQNALSRPEYSSPASVGRKLPPIADTAVGSSTTALISPLLPGMTKTDLDNNGKPELGSEDMEHIKEFNQGCRNVGFEEEQETNFTSKKHDIETVEANGRKASEVSQSRKRLRSTRFFQDGKRKIDFVMAYEDSGDDPKNENRRRTFESGLVQKGLELETEPKETSQNEKTCFVKIHVPYATRLVYAERMKMKMPLKVEKSSEDEDDDSDSCKCNWYSQLEEFLTQPFVLENENLRHKEDDDNYTAEFRADRIEFFDVEDEETFFGECDRSRIAYRIMCETQFEEERASVGINQLINLGGYSNVFPLHDGQHQVDKKDENSMVINAADTNMRRILYEEWARWGRWYKFQPLDAIRSYLGDKLALYFAWLGFYTEMLIYPTIVGFICFIYSIISMGSHAPTLEVCDANYATYAGDEPMCPLCDRECSYWNLTSSCLASQITYVFDNESTIFFAIFMSVWATMFLEFWKRRQFKLNYKWDLVDYDEARDLIRPEFEAQVTRERINPVTRQREPYLSETERCQRMCLSAVTVFFWVIVVIAAVIAVIIYRITISAVFAVSIDYEALGTIGTIATPALLTTVTGSIISLVIIMGLNVVYEKIAMALTNIELPRTQTEFEDSFTFKMFCFQFVNYYSYLFYIAFLKQALAGHPNKYNYFAGRYRWEECDAGGCMYELSLQLIIIMVGKQIWNNMIELLLPWAMNKYRQWKSTKASIDAPGNRYTRWEQDYDLTPFLPLELFYEYLEMVIQFGFVTLFVVAFPLAPVLALLNNIVEIRLDANKIICEYRRPVSHKCSDIGVWYYLLDFIGTLAVVTNAFTIAFTSETIPKIVYYWSYSIENGNSERTYRGYTNNSLSVFAVSDFTALSRPMTNEYNTTYCRYKDYRAPPGGEDAYQLTTQYWNVMAGRLVFVIVMEHLVIFLKRFLDYLIPDRPQGLRCQIKREHYLVQQLLVRAEADHLVRQSNQESALHGRDELTLEQSESANAQADALDNLKEFEEASGTAAAQLKFKFNFNFNSNLTFKPTPTTMTTEEEKEPDDGGEKSDESQDNGVAS